MHTFGVLAGLLAIAPRVSCHSHVSQIVVNGDAYTGFDPRGTNDDILAAWYTEVEEDGWIGLNDYETPNMACHLNAENAQGYATIAAGERVSWFWMGWPESHKGPVLTYMAYCGADSESCATVNKTSLEFFEISRAALLDPTRRATDYSQAMGYWATDLIIEKNNTWLVEIPSQIEPGFYVLRHEIIALHYAQVAGQGPQHYPQCMNVKITGSGTSRPQGVVATELYRADDPGLNYDIFDEELQLPYEIPGPKLISGVEGTVTQSASRVREHVAATPAVSKADS